MITSVRLHQFKNHAAFQAEISGSVVCTGGNGAGKTNLLEAVYVGINGIAPPGRTFDDCISMEAESGFVRLAHRGASDLAPEYSVILSREGASPRFLVQGESVSRPKYLAHHGRRAVLFSPIEMNLLYLGPSLRRDFLDEVLLLSFPEFLRIRREYFQVNRSRNTLLKHIREGISVPGELDAWDLLFCEKGAAYLEYRYRLISFFEERTPRFSRLISPDCTLRLTYESKTDRSDPRTSIKKALSEGRDRDIAVGHTSVGPHVDDFFFETLRADTARHASEFLSRGENKTLLVALKLASVEFLEKSMKSEAILLLDDIASELDESHLDHLFDAFSGRQFFLTGHHIPSRVIDRIPHQRIDLK